MRKFYRYLPLFSHQPRNSYCKSRVRIKLALLNNNYKLKFTKLKLSTNLSPLQRPFFCTWLLFSGWLSLHDFFYILLLFRFKSLSKHHNHCISRGPICLQICRHIARNPGYIVSGCQLKRKIDSIKHHQCVLIFFHYRWPRLIQSIPL